MTPPIQNAAPQDPSVRYVSFSAEINVKTSEPLIALMAQYVTQGVTEVNLLLSTPGGDVLHGMALYTTLKGLPFRVVTHNVGSVNSIGNAVFLAGEPRYTVPHGTFMFHGVGFDTTPGQRLERKILKQCLDGIQADEKRIAEIIADRTMIDLRAAQRLFLEASTKDAAYAVSKGIVHEVRELQIPPGVAYAAFTFQR
jgi:ATP-dependent protease ClpP protease subunit